MKNHYVETGNHDRFAAAIRAAEARGSRERCMVLVTGIPGAGKTCTLYNWGANVASIHMDGIPGMSVRFLNDYLSDQTGIPYKSTQKFAFDKALGAYLKDTKRPIVLDEAQHGLPKNAECIEYLRRVAERAGILLVLACHTSERHKFVGSGLAHIADRIHTVAELKEASLEDCAAYLKALCEVAVDEGIIKQVHEQSRGRYRLMSDAGVTLEAIARKKNATALAVADTKGFRLCEDAMTSLRRSAK